MHTIMNHTHEFDVGPMDLSLVIRILRTLDERWQEMIAGLHGSKVHLRCRDKRGSASDEVYANWVRAWRELAG